MVKSTAEIERDFGANCSDCINRIDQINTEIRQNGEKYKPSIINDLQYEKIGIIDKLQKLVLSWSEFYNVDMPTKGLEQAELEVIGIFEKVEVPNKEKHI